LSFNKYQKEMINKCKNMIQKRNYKLDNEILNNLQYKVKMPMNYVSIYQTIKSNVFEKKQNIVDVLLLQKLQDETNIFYNSLYDLCDKQFLINDLDIFVQKLIHNDKIDFAYLSTHDKVLFFYAKYLFKNKIFNNIEYPEYCSCIIIEVFDDDTTNFIYNNAFNKS